MAAQSSSESKKRSPRRQWRDYRTVAGGRPVKDYLDGLEDEEVAAVIAGMKDVAREGLRVAKHLRGDIYEIRADASTRSFRLLFSAEGRYSQVLLSLSAFRQEDAEDSGWRAGLGRVEAPRLAGPRSDETTGTNTAGQAGMILGTS